MEECPFSLTPLGLKLFLEMLGVGLNKLFLRRVELSEMDVGQIFCGFRS